MANVEHRTMVSADVHEPKYISDSTAADAGKVITPLSGGSSELRYLTPDEVGVNFSYGEVNTDNNAVNFSITAATDTTLSTGSDYILLNSTRLPTTAGESFGITYDNVNNTLTTSIAGVYRIGGWFNVSSDTVNTKIGVRYTSSGAPSGGKLVTDIKDVGRTQNLSGFGLITLPVGAVIGVSIASDKTANLTISDMRLNLELIRET